MVFTDDEYFECWCICSRTPDGVPMRRWLRPARSLHEVRRRAVVHVANTSCTSIRYAKRFDPGWAEMVP